MHDQFTDERTKRLSRSQPLQWRCLLLPFKIIAYGAYLLFRIWLLLGDD
jgi:hypothetical protein